MRECVLKRVVVGLLLAPFQISSFSSSFERANAVECRPDEKVSHAQEENTAILQKLAELRREKSALLGYNSHAEFIHEMRMAENPARVTAFLSSLAGRGAA